jgi:two-component system, OmpR family, KDP operon response regulator KdpE
VLLDLGLPDMDGLEVIRQLRQWASVPIIIISERGQERDKIDGLDARADDYLSKPFSVGELLARTRAALRRMSATPAEPAATEFTAGELSINLQTREVRVADRTIHLTPIEIRLLTVLVRHAGMVLTHRQIMKEVWAPHTRRTSITCASTSTSCARRSKRTQRDRVTS